ncbi:DUF1404 domain-containing protein [Stygiolobus caldivivus]|uniref:DUF1404 domain-containing protein n=1 Tax=Stygiolobus caldivivus TaxID=2824673 RepID=A0A8D5ZIY4_9CREN|nr:DUF1404 domain-containing protein [Stygiolobus caldivivus]BCU71009.1 hypothetical protein KN1_23060 [Stygiolobus caldivivus]
MKKLQIGDKRPLIVSIILTLAFINPIVEELMFSEEPVFMASHYALVFAGALVGYYYWGKNIRLSLLGYLGAVLVVVWHLPQLFVLGGAEVPFRALDELSLFLGGALLGIGVRNMRLIEKLLLLVLWMIGDTTLAVVLIISYPFYTIPPSPYTLSQEPLTGYVMVIAMTFVLGYLVFKGFQNLNIFG